MQKQEPTVLKVITPTQLEIDLNNNGKADENELVCVQDTKTFTANLKHNNEALAKELNLPYIQALSIGYLTDKFAKETLEGKKVNIVMSDNQPPNCINAEVYINDFKYTDLLAQQGFTSDKMKDKNTLKTLLDNASKLKLVILNHKSQKYHTPDCSYGQAAEDAVVILQKELPKDTHPCKFCHIKNTKRSKNLHHKPNNIYQSAPPPPSIITSGDIRLILTDFTTILKPNRNCSHEACKEFITAIENAQESIDIAAYGFVSIPEIDRALSNAQERGVKIRIVYDIDSNHNNYYPETLDFVSRFIDTRSDEIPGKANITNMLMHNKFAIFDNKKVFTGSMNFSGTGLSGFNHNNIVIINSKEIANLYKQEFNQMFNGKFHTLKSKIHSDRDFILNESQISVYFSPKDFQIINKLIPLIRHSKKYIYVPTFIITHKPLKNELISAKNRGVEVKIIIDATNTSSPKSAFFDMRKNGLNVKVENFAGKMHSKSMIIDDEYIIVGSTNFSNSGETRNDENMLIIKDSKLAIAYKNYFMYTWNKIPNKYLNVVIGSESKDSIGSCSDGVDNDYDELIDSDDEGCK